MLLLAGAALFTANAGSLSLPAIDDCFYARKGVEMARGGPSFTVTWNGEAAFQNPPLPFWVLGASFRLLGENDFAARLPVRVLAHRMGLPAEDVPALKAWSDAWVEPLSYGCSLERELEIAWQGVELQRSLARQMEKRRKEPGDDLLSALSGTESRARPRHQVPHTSRAGPGKAGAGRLIQSAVLVALGLSLGFLFYSPGSRAPMRSALARSCNSETLPPRNVCSSGRERSA